ncbi:Putative protein without homology [Lacticaseibacillus rhamnosus GG]|nr:Putative protein without homology [Lacticaseibacillus rhamnosus GG]
MCWVALSVTRSQGEKPVCKDLGAMVKLGPLRLRPRTLRLLTAPARAP